MRLVWPASQHGNPPHAMAKARVRLAMAVIPVLLGTAVARAAPADEITKGHTLATACARCHAIGSQGQSPLPQAPAFRTLGQRYPLVDLEESLAEGIMTGHPDMPEVTWEPDQIDAFIAYLQSIQTGPSTAGTPATGSPHSGAPQRPAPKTPATPSPKP